MWYRHSISNCSKAPWGLSVLSRVTCIFTGTKISPSLSLRQCPNHYAFRAGRNLPDKEFRYLRTVIVTAVVHQDLGSELAPLPVIFWHRTGITPYTSSCDLARSCVFGKQSPGLVSCGLSDKCWGGRSYPEVTTAVLQSSLSSVIPSTLMYSHPPTSVRLRYGYIHSSQSGFSWHLHITGPYLSLPKKYWVRNHNPLVLLCGFAYTTKSITLHSYPWECPIFAMRPHIGNNLLYIVLEY